MYKVPRLARVFGDGLPNTGCPLLLLGGNVGIFAPQPHSTTSTRFTCCGASDEPLRSKSIFRWPISLGSVEVCYCSLRSKKRHSLSGDTLSQARSVREQLCQAVSGILNTRTLRGTYGAPAPHPSESTSSKSTWVREVGPVLADKKKLRICKLHPKKVVYDGLRCPACAYIQEMPPATRIKLFREGRKVYAKRKPN